MAVGSGERAQPAALGGLRGARCRRGRDGRFADLRAACRCRPLCERILAHRAGAAVSLAPGRGTKAASGDLPRASLCRSLLAGVFFAGDLFFWHLSIMATTVANATFFATTSPIWVAFGAWLIYSRADRAADHCAASCCASRGGAALLGQSYGFAPERLVGDLYGLITAVFFGALHSGDAGSARQRYGAARLTLDLDRDHGAVPVLRRDPVRQRVHAAIAAGDCGAGRAGAGVAGGRPGPARGGARQSAGDVLRRW